MGKSKTWPAKSANPEEAQARTVDHYLAPTTFP
jgi:hypothetical protein